VVQIRVVTGPQEGFGVAAHQFGVQMGNDGDLILATHHREDAADLRVGERGVDIGGPGRRTGPDPACRGKLDGNQAGHLGEPAHRLLMNSGKGTGRRERR
jgi:hypothetical protein